MNKPFILLRVECVGKGVFFFIWNQFQRVEGITGKIWPIGGQTSQIVVAVQVEAAVDVAYCAGSIFSF